MKKCSKCGAVLRNDVYGSRCEDCFALAADASSGWYQSHQGKTKQVSNQEPKSIKK